MKNKIFNVKAIILGGLLGVFGSQLTALIFATVIFGISISYPRENLFNLINKIPDKIVINSLISIPILLEMIFIFIGSYIGGRIAINSEIKHSLYIAFVVIVLQLLSPIYGGSIGAFNVEILHVSKQCNYFLIPIIVLLLSVLGGYFSKKRNINIRQSETLRSNPYF